MTYFEPSQTDQMTEQRARNMKGSLNSTEPQPKGVSAAQEDAARSVMHPDSYDPDWRYYHGAMAG